MVNMMSGESIGGSQGQASQRVITSSFGSRPSGYFIKWNRDRKWSIVEVLTYGGNQVDSLYGFLDRGYVGDLGTKLAD